MTRMPLTEESFRDQAIDYLDNLLSEEDRAAFEEACRKNPVWATYVSELGTTWRRAGRLLQQAQEAAPARVMAHVMAEAEKRAAVLAATTVPTMPAVQAARPARDLWSVVKGWFARPWLAPVLVATAAVGFYVFSQESWKSARPQSMALDPVQQEVAKEESVDPQVGPGAARSSMNPKEALAERKADAVVERRSHARGGVPAKAADRRAMKPAARKAKTQERDDDTLGGLLDEGPAAGWGSGKGEGYAAPPSGWRGSAEKKVAADGVNQMPAPRPEPTAEAPKRVPAPSSGGSAGARAPSLSAAPPPLAAAPPPAAAPAPPAAAPASPAQGFMRNSEAEEAAPSDAENAKAPALSRADLLQKAAFAETNGDWQSAVQTYRELLRRFPHDKDAARWKQRLVTASSHLR